MKKILIVDEESLITRFLETRLTREGFSVVFATDGQLALALIREQKYDLILVDLMIPNVAGLELIMEIQKTPINSETPIMVMTSLSSGEMIVDVLASGVKDYIVKPFSVNAIVTKLKQLTEMSMIIN